MTGLSDQARVPQVLTVEHDKSLHRALHRVVQASNAQPVFVETLAEARRALETTEFAAVLLEQALPDGDGLDLLRARSPLAQAQHLVLVDDVASSVDAYQLGAFDCVMKPFDLDGLTQRLTVALDTQRHAAERSRLQDLLTHSERLASLGTLSAGIAHEINNPLSYVLVNVGLLSAELRRFGQADAMPLQELIECADAAREGAENIRQIVADLRAWARGNDGDLRAVDVRAVIDSSLKISGSSLLGRARVLREDAPVPLALATPSRLGQVLVNLLVNAAQAMPERPADQNTITLRTFTRGEQVVLEVADNGSGIPRELAGKLFEAFFTTKPVGQGTGLGLHLSRKIVRDFGGDIELESEPGRGTTFRVVLRAAPRDDAS